MERRPPEHKPISKDMAPLPPPQLAGKINTTMDTNKRRASGSGSGPACQAERCTADLTEAKRYHRRHKVCEAHSKAPVVLVAGLRQRFCQQCSRFHEIMEFDDAKRSCRRRLAGHNQRRRKSAAETQGCNEVDHGERIQMGLSEKRLDQIS